MLGASRTLPGPRSETGFIVSRKFDDVSVLLFIRNALHHGRAPCRDHKISRLPDSIIDREGMIADSDRIRDKVEEVFPDFHDSTPVFASPTASG